MLSWHQTLRYPGVCHVPCAIDLSLRFLVQYLAMSFCHVLLCMLEGAKLLTTLTSQYIIPHSCLKLFNSQCEQGIDTYMCTRYTCRWMCTPIHLNIREASIYMYMYIHVL